MFGDSFYFSLIRKYVASFGSLFNNIAILRTDSTGSTTEIIKVPITYAPKEKMLARVTGDPNIDRQSATITLPVISFEMVGLDYDSSRKLTTINKISKVSANNSVMSYQYNPVPYNLTFKLSILSKNIEDANKILEQIIPYFTPDYTLTLEIIPEMSLKLDVPIILKSITPIDTYDSSFVDRQTIEYTLMFTMKVNFYGPIKSNSVILFTNTRFYTPTVPDGSLPDAVGNSNVVSYITIQPGLTPNGQPTSNSHLTVDAYSIKATDDFGYITTIDSIPDFTNYYIRGIDFSNPADSGYMIII